LMVSVGRPPDFLRRPPTRVNIRLRSMRRRLVPEGLGESSPVRSAGLVF
jgi:hypothetical protein